MAEFEFANAPKMDVLSPKFFWETIFMEVPALTNNTAKTSFREDLVKMRPAVAEQSRQMNNTERPLKLDVPCSERRRLNSSFA